MSIPGHHSSSGDLRVILESLPDPFFILDHAWRFVYVNAHATLFLQRDAEQLIGRVLWEGFPHARGIRFEEHAREATREARLVEYEAYSAPHGLWLEIRVSPYETGVGVTVRNITRRKRAEEQQRHLYRLTSRLNEPLAPPQVARVILEEALPMLGASGGTVHDLTDAGTLECLEHIGTPGPAAFGTRPAPTALHARDELYARAAATPQGLFLDAAEYGRYVPPALPGVPPGQDAGSAVLLPLRVDERSVGLLTFTFPARAAFQDDERTLLVSVAQQCAQALDRARLQQAQQSRYDQLHAVLRHLPVGVIIADVPTGRTVTGNPEVERMLGQPLIPGQDIATDHAGRATHLDGRPLQPHEWPLTRAARHGEVIQGEEIRYERHPGDVRHLRLGATRVRTDSGEAAFVIVAVDDVTDLRRNERALRDLNATLEERVRERTRELSLANEELEAFSYSVSHDLRTPVRHIRGFTQLLSRAVQTPGEKRDRYLRNIDTAAQQMEALIEGLLAFSRLAQQPVARENVPLTDIVRDVRAQLEPDYATRDVEWRVGTLPVVRADPALLRIAVTNLLSNAVKYTRTRPRAVIEVDAEDGGDEWTVTVRDNGVGFDAAYTHKLFGVFQRLHRADEFEGTGVGLANVRRIITRHGGRVWAEGRAGEGARVSFTLPK